MPDLHIRPTRDDALAVLRVRTAAAHQRLEDRLDLLRVDTDRVREVARTLETFWAVGEPGVDAWAQTEPDLAVALDWPRRRRSAFRPAEPVTTATALGWLYVREGSTLGGAVIARRHGITLSTFTPYAEGPGPMWRRYLEVLQRSDAEPDAVADAAVDTFAALELLCREGPS